MLNLSADEQAWLDEFRRQLEEQFPGLVEDIIIFGPYSRGISDPDVDFNTLVLIKEGDRKKAEKVADLGYMVDVDTVCGARRLWFVLRRNGKKPSARKAGFTGSRTMVSARCEFGAGDCGMAWR